MHLEHYTYLLLNIATLFFPLLLSFDKKVAFYRKWRSVLPAIALTALLFIPWDMYKTHAGVWSFNPEYVLGVWIGNLPLEEWLFFFTVPYAILFIYECLKAYLPDVLQGISVRLSKIVFVLLVFITVFFTDRMYTVITFPLAAAFLLAHTQFFGNRYLGRFWMAYFVHLIPFFVVNGLLTSLPVVQYNPEEYIGLRIFTVPVEDTVYSMLLLLMNVTFFEWLEDRKKVSSGSRQ